MRVLVTGLALLLWLISALPGRAQILYRPTSPPTVTAGDADWQVRGEPMCYATRIDHPAGPTVFFDGFTMVQAGTYQEVPVYVDSTIEPHSIVLVPIGRGLMRQYERRREGDIAGTVGSRTPAFPVQRDFERSAVDAPRCLVSEMAALAPNRAAALVTSAPALAPAPVPNDGRIAVFGGRWRSTGQTVAFVADQFVQIAEYQKQPVYRSVTGRIERIYVAAPGGMLTVYTR